MAGEFEKLAYDAALRSLDKQERLLEELRARTGVLLAASSVAITLLGQQAFRGPGGNVLTAIGLAAFVVSISGSVLILLPRNGLIFAEAGAKLYRSFFAIRDDLPEVYRRLAYLLDGFWEINEQTIARLAIAYIVAATALVVEILALAALLGTRIV